MKGNVGHIKNPLTVISQFAAIAEISGTIVLPFIAPENQAIYIWFLMLFPAFLVGIFFLTLNFNHKTLYAPSDYSNQDHFLNLFGIVTSTERDAKLIAEVEEAEETENLAFAEEPSPPVAADPERPVGDELKSEPVVKEPTNDASNEVKQTEKEADQMFDLAALARKSSIEQLAKLEYIEKRSVETLKQVTNLKFSAKVKFEIPGRKKPIIFDAIADEGDTIHIAEVKYFPDNRFTPSRFKATIENAYLASHTITNISNRKVQLHLVVVLNELTSNLSADDIRREITKMALSMHLDCKVYITTAAHISTGLTPPSWRWTSQNT